MSIKGVWSSISEIGSEFDKRGIDFESLFKRVVGNNDNTLYQIDQWCGDNVLKEVYPNLYVVEKNKDCLSKERVCIENGHVMNYCWDWARQLRRRRETDQFVAMVEQVVAFTFVDGRDRWKWEGDGDT